MESQKEYYAFISYKREDEKWAEWLQNKLEHYHFPTNLNGRTDLPHNIRPTFRDVTDLTSGLLVEEIDKALRSSEWLIIICSPRSAKSQWVCKEAQAFIDLGYSDHIIPFVIEGTPFSDNDATECYPQALLNLTGSHELLATNINEMGRDAATIKVVARMFNLRFDALWQRYEREKRWKRWIYIWIATIVAIISIVFGSYFVDQNRVIERQYSQLQTATDRLKDDSVIMHNHLLRIRRDSLTMASQNDSITLQNNIILSQRDSIDKSYMSLKRANYMLSEEHKRVISANIDLNISILKKYISDGRAEMALLSLKEIDDNIMLLDSTQYKNYLCAKQLLRDSILISTALIAHISDTTNRHLPTPNVTFKNIQLSEEDDVYGVYISNRVNNTIDSICSYDPIKPSVNRNLTLFAMYSDGDSGESYMPNNPGIRIYSIADGALKYFIPCYAWYNWMTYPMSISNDGMSVLYREGHKAFDGIWFINLATNKKSLLTNYNNDSGEYALSAFSPNDEQFYIYYPSKNNIDVYSTKTLEITHRFRYEECDDVFWDDCNLICISSRGNIYSWQILDSPRNCIITIPSYAEGVRISNDNTYAAAACNDGTTYIWDITNGGNLLAKEMLTAPQDVAFTNDNRYLWVISGYNEISRISMDSNTIDDICTYNSPGHPWSAFLHMTADGKYCIGRCFYGDTYVVCKINGEVVDAGSDASNCNDSILREFIFPDKIHFDPVISDIYQPQLTARRVSLDGEMCIESYSNGVLRIFSIEDMSNLDFTLEIN